MKLVPLKQWFCDKCGGIIGKAEDGYFEWIEDDSDLNYGFRIVHFKTCQINEQTLSRTEHLQDLQLDEFVGDVGMVRLLELIQSRKFRDIDEFLEVFHRLQVTYYEEARTYFTQAAQDGYIEDINDRNNKFPDRALDVIQKYAK